MDDLLLKLGYDYNIASTSWVPQGSLFTRMNKWHIYVCRHLNPRKNLWSCDIEFRTLI